MTSTPPTSERQPREHPVQCPSCPPGNTTWSDSGLCNKHLALLSLFSERQPREHPVQCPSCPPGNTTWSDSGLCNKHLALLSLCIEHGDPR